MVEPRRAAIVAGAIVAGYVAALYCVHPVPDLLVGMLGGARGVEREGGLVVRYQPPPHSEQAVRRAMRGASVVRREGDLLVIDFVGVDREMVGDINATLNGGGLMFKVAVETDYAVRVGPSGGVTLEPDRWIPETGGPPHATFYLKAATVEELRAALDAAASRGFALPPGHEIAFEYVEAPREGTDRRPFWRTYELESEVVIDGAMIDSATVSVEPSIGRPIVLLDFTREGGRRFCELTERIVGQKLATMLGGTIRSAPIINSRICGGRASITMGGTDPDRQAREAKALATVLSQNTLPLGGHVVDEVFVPRRVPVVQIWVARALLGLLAGLVAAVIAWLVVRFARPAWAAMPAAAGGFPWNRLFVTLCGPLFLWLAPEILLPGLNIIELENVLRGASLGTQGSVFALGITPILFAAGLVELVALAVPRLRWRRHDPRGRRRLAQATAIVALAFALAQGYLLASYWEALSRGGAEVVDRPGLRFRLLVMVSLATGTLVLGGLAGFIRERGLGNGYGVLIAFGFVLGLWPDDLGMLATPRYALGIAAVAAIALLSLPVLRWRVGEPALRLPLSGISPLADTSAIFTLAFALAGLAGGFAFERVLGWRAALSSPLALLVAALVSTPLWAWVFARPRLVAPVAALAGHPAPSRRDWQGALAISVAWLAGVTAIGGLATSAGAPADVAEPIAIVVTVAVVLDVIADGLVRRGPLVVVGALQQVQHVAVVERALLERFIPAHFHASHLRALLAFFGPWAPVLVMVPEVHAAQARALVEELVAGVSRSTRRPGA